MKEKAELENTEVNQVTSSEQTAPFLLDGGLSPRPCYFSSSNNTIFHTASQCQNSFHHMLHGFHSVLLHCFYIPRLPVLSVLCYPISLISQCFGHKPPRELILWSTNGPKPKQFKGEGANTARLSIPGTHCRGVSGSPRGWTLTGRCQPTCDQADPTPSLHPDPPAAQCTQTLVSTPIRQTPFLSSLFHLFPISFTQVVTITINHMLKTPTLTLQSNQTPIHVSRCLRDVST